MAITNITVSNFKSFKNLDLALGQFNVVIGANAAGKSNFTQVFKFLRDIEQNKLDDAVFMHGGPFSLLNRKVGSTQDLRIKAVSNKQMGWGRGSRFMRVYESTYELALHFTGPKSSLNVAVDELRQKFETGAPRRKKMGKLFEDDAVDKGEFWSRTSDGKLHVGIEPAELERRLEEEHILPPLSFFSEARSETGGKSSLAIQSPFSPLTPPWQTLFGDIGTYNIDPHIAREPCPVGGKPELQESGRNFALILRQILDNPENSRKFHNLLQDLLPFVVEVSTEKYPEKSVLITLRENYYTDAFFAHLLSDGTMNLAALVVALYFENKDLVIIEEPERNIHPHLISRLVEMMKDASRNRQIIVTTHSPEVVWHAGIENLLLLSRDQDGFSIVSRPAEKEEVKIFLEHELGLDELFVQDLLAV
jgi:predicted ATPase